MRSAASQALFLIGKPSSKAKAGRLRRESEKQSSRASHNQETADIRAAVDKRAAGVWCESIGLHGNGAWLHGGKTEWDHWLHGNGRRRQYQSVETTWMLCRSCHRARQENHPSAAYWNAIFQAHCRKYGYPFEAHIEHQPEPAKAGGAP